MKITRQKGNAFMENETLLNNNEQTSSTNTKSVSEVIQNIRNEILPKLPELKGQDPEAIETFIDSVITTHTTPEQKEEIINSLFLVVAMHEQDP